MSNLVELWILVSAACVAAGWILSALHALNTVGYVAFFILSGIAGIFWASNKRLGEHLSLARFIRRFRRPLPFLYAVALALAFLGGAIYAPNNYDALGYRLPRMLHWWSAGHWLWIPTSEPRMNFSATGIEWLMLPLFALTHSDRLFFLINAVSYFLLPGLIFACFTALGVSRRVAWFWMWLLPMGYCYAMQAGGIGNDAFGTIYILAAIWFGVRARRGGGIWNLTLCALAAALATGAKVSNLPLLLPVAWAVWPAFRLIRLHPVYSVAAAVCAVLVSFAPVACLNAYYTGGWTGDPNDTERAQIHKPLAGIVGNGIQLAVGSLELPLQPEARPVAQWLSNHLPATLRSSLPRDFPRFEVALQEIPQEESAGIGVGITAMALVSLLFAWRYRNLGQINLHVLVGGALAWAAVLVFAVKSGSNQTARLLASYYPLLLLPLMAMPGLGSLVRRPWMRNCALVIGALVVLVLVLTPARPLWPGQTILWRLHQAFPRNAQLARACDVYSVYSRRSHFMDPLLRHIPASVATIGLMATWEDAEGPLWRPFGSRTVVRPKLTPGLDRPPAEWVVLKNSVVAKTPADLKKWVSQHGGEILAEETITSRAEAGPEEWSVLRFTNAPPAAMTYLE